MSGISPIPGATPPIPRPQMNGPHRQGSSVSEGQFGRALLDYVRQVDAQQHESAAAIQQLLSGKSQDVLPTVAAVAKADLSFKLLLGIRNKVIEAYKQTMNMQI